MSEAARVTSVDDLARFRAALVKALDELRLAIGEAESEVGRMRGWIERDQQLYWQSQHRKAQEDVAVCKSALFRKQMVTSSKDQKPSVVDEKKALERAQRRLALCEERRAAVKKWAVQITREEILFKAGLAPLSAMVDRELPHALALLTRMLEHLDAYTSLQAPDLSGIHGGKTEELVADMRRRGDEVRSMLGGASEREAPETLGAPAPRSHGDEPHSEPPMKEGAP